MYSVYTKLFFAILSMCIYSQTSGQNDILITSDFPGGNIELLSIENDTVRLNPDNSFTEGEWFYWYFKASNIPGRRITFKFEQENVLARYGPGYSLNNDHSWKWFGEYRIKDNSFTFLFSETDSIIYLSTAFPYVENNFNQFISKLRNQNILSIDTLCISPEGRRIEKVIIPSSSGDSKHKILITARHHACEMMANYVLEGIIETILNDSNCKHLRDDAEFMIIPFMDKDGVENGDQGKNRIPRDHNRDYIDESIHHSTEALRNIVPTWSNHKLKIALDLHCPWIHTTINETIYIVGNSDPEMEKQQIIFSKMLEKYATGDLKLFHKDFIQFGTSWNTASNYSKGRSFAGWAATLDSIKLTGTIEFPYANVSGIPVSKDGAREFGKAVAYSINDYLQLKYQ